MSFGQAGHHNIFRLEAVLTTPFGTEAILVTLLFLERFVDDEPREETERVPVEGLRMFGIKGNGGARWRVARGVARGVAVVARTASLSIAGRVGFNEGERPPSLLPSKTCVSSERLNLRTLA